MRVGPAEADGDAEQGRLRRDADQSGALARAAAREDGADERAVLIVAEEAEEIRKVERKLPRWARNQQQINSKILNLFLELKYSGTERVTEDLLTRKYGDYGEFSRNYNQMKIISPKNHAKVFEVKNGVVEIWEPVRRYVEEYKKAVFNGRY